MGTAITGPRRYSHRTGSITLRVQPLEMAEISAVSAPPAYRKTSYHNNRADFILGIIFNSRSKRLALIADFCAGKRLV